MRTWRALALALVIGALGCSVDESAGSAAALSEEPTLVFHRRVVEPAPGSDQRPLHSLAWRHPNGRLESIDLPRPALHAVALGSVLYWVDGNHRLHRLEDGFDEPIHEGVFARPIVGGARVLFVQGDAGEAQTIHWQDSHGASGRLATGLYQLGALTLAPDGSAVLGVGSRNGGVAGLWVVPFEGEPHCLSNCGLRVGAGALILANPAMNGLRFEGDEVRWDTPAGTITRRWTRP